jgi:hypothetical protein
VDLIFQSAPASLEADPNSAEALSDGQAQRELQENKRMCQTVAILMHETEQTGFAKKDRACRSSIRLEEDGQVD